MYDAMIPNYSNSELLDRAEEHAHELDDQLFIELCLRFEAAMRDQEIDSDAINKNKDRRTKHG
jgi:hypothetical protein